MRLRAGDLGADRLLVIYEGVRLAACVEASEEERWAEIRIGVDFRDGKETAMWRTVRLRGDVRIVPKPKP